MNSLPEGWVITTVGAVVTLNPKNDCHDADAAGFVPMNLLGVRYLSPFEFEKRKWGQVKKALPVPIAGSTYPAVSTATSTGPEVERSL